jgi:hypothetical protein
MSCRKQSPHPAEKLDKEQRDMVEVLLNGSFEDYSAMLV